MFVRPIDEKRSSSVGIREYSVYKIELDTDTLDEQENSIPARFGTTNIGIKQETIAFDVEVIQS